MSYWGLSYGFINVSCSGHGDTTIHIDMLIFQDYGTISLQLVIGDETTCSEVDQKWNLGSKPIFILLSTSLKLSDRHSQGPLQMLNTIIRFYWQHSNLFLRGLKLKSSRWPPMISKVMLPGRKLSFVVKVQERKRQNNGLLLFWVGLLSKNMWLLSLMAHIKGAVHLLCILPLNNDKLL